MSRFKDLNVWVYAHDLSVEIYNYTKNFPEDERYGMTSQIRRAAISVCCNIAEMTGKYSRKEQNRFIEIAYASLMELENLVYLSHSISYIDNKIQQSLVTRIEKVSRMLSGLKAKISTQN